MQQDRWKNVQESSTGSPRLTAAGNRNITKPYDIKNNIDLEYGCSVEYAYENYGDREIVRIQSVFENGNAYFVFSIK